MTARKRIERGIATPRLEVDPTTLASVPTGNAGQVAPVSDQGMHRLFVRNVDDMLVPATAVATTTPITMEVDYTLGTSPDAGTVVTSQAEYDALVAGFTNPYLKYPQDGVDILPSVIRQRVEIHLGAGLHYAKPDSFYNPGMSATLVLGDKIFDYTGIGYRNAAFAANPVIAFIGDMEEVEAEQGGTASNSPKTILRNSGTWTIDEHKGKYASIITGAGAGNIYLIESNTADILHVVAYSVSTGTCTFEIVTPVTIWQNGDYGFWTDRIGAIGALEFTDIQFGTPAVPLLYSTMASTNMRFTRCPWYEAGTVAYSPYFMFGGRVEFYSCYLRWDSHYGVWLEGKVRTIMCLVAPAHDQARDDIGAINCISQYGVSEFYSSYSVIEAVGTFARQLLATNGGALDLDGGVVLRGNGLATAIAVDAGRGSKAGGELTMSGPQLNDWGTAVRVYPGGKVRVHSVSGSGNATAWKLEGGAFVVGPDPTTLGGTTEIDIDGNIHDYTDVPSAGDWIEGAGGSRFIR